MDVNTGAIIAMASYPNYDLNDYSTIFDAALQKKLDADLEKIDANRSTYESEKAYADARAKAINSAMQSQWRNKCIDSTYEPGSTFKPITLAAAPGGGQGFQKPPRSTAAATLQFRAGATVSGAPTTAVTASRR